MNYLLTVSYRHANATTNADAATTDADGGPAHGPHPRQLPARSGILDPIGSTDREAKGRNARSFSRFRNEKQIQDQELHGSRRLQGQGGDRLLHQELLRSHTALRHDHQGQLGPRSHPLAPTSKLPVVLFSVLPAVHGSKRARGQRHRLRRAGVVDLLTRVRRPRRQWRSRAPNRRSRLHLLVLRRRRVQGDVARRLHGGRQDQQAMVRRAQGGLHRLRQLRR